jgi:hypothetical protein
MPDRDNFYGALREVVDFMIQHYHETVADRGEDEAHLNLMTAVEASNLRVALEIKASGKVEWDTVLMDVAFAMVCLYLDMEEQGVEIRTNTADSVSRDHAARSKRYRGRGIY